MRAAAREGARYWDAVARDNAAWYIATGCTAQDAAFFAQGAAEVDQLTARCGICLRPDDTVLEIGCGVGRMTHRLAEVSARVIAADISQEMLDHCVTNLAGVRGVEFLLVPGDGTLPMPDHSVDVVFSYITLQHIPSPQAQLRYLHESLRVLRPGGRLAVQLRAPGVRARALDWAGYVAHFAQGRATIHPAWRGTRVRRADVLAVSSLLQMRHFNVRHCWAVIPAAEISAR